MQTYSGVRTDSTRWSQFNLRSGDVIISTPPKCGTTWMIAIVSMLLQGSTDLPMPTGVTSPWLDYSPIPFEEVLTLYGGQNGRRVIKTHTPVDGLPQVNGTRVISVSRNPIDAMRSMRRHLSNMASPPAGDPFLADEETVIARGLDLPFQSTNVDDVCLELLVRHLRAAADAIMRDDSRTILVHYSDMKRDLENVVARVSEFIEAKSAGGFLDEVAQATSIASMRSKADHFAPRANGKHFSSTERFFAAGEERGQSELAPSLRARYEKRLAELLPRPEARWLDRGGHWGVAQGQDDG